MSNESESTKTMTTGQLLTSYGEAIKAGLDNGYQYVKAFDQLNDTTDQAELLAAAVQLTNYQLNADFVVFPHQFSDEDVQLIFLERILQLANVGNSLQISNPDHVQKLLCKFAALGDQTFTFTKSTKNTTGFFFGPTDYNRPLFYLNLATKELLFHGASLIDYFVVDLQGTDVADLKATLQVLLKVAEILKEHFGFKIDFNVLDGINNEFYKFAAGDVSESIMDELFVKSADNQFILMADQNGGASLNLDHDIQLKVYNMGSADRPQWGASIHDPDQKESFVYLLLDYPFIQEWYLDNKKQLGILSNQLIFG
ncbi:hypothetical protein YK48G_03010 [Lentilactobacillus fungorum]|uniref:Uncharacterized protein n=1 Tax=Lentilactobacillus fungorum TaxID=2201250 RepID=A0ABQ3VWS6_9LACO|nr:hypothetical protein [Lentilactobacillus fungorum]GHP12876.1 hypothetical protein YK48G_03010 [Lentilactobacillus fungorum]